MIIYVKKIPQLDRLQQVTQTTLVTGYTCYTGYSSHILHKIQITGAVVDKGADPVLLFKKTDAKKQQNK